MRILSQKIVCRFTDGTEKQFGLTTGASSEGLQDEEFGHDIARRMAGRSDIVSATLTITRTEWLAQENDDDSGYQFFTETKEYK